MKVGILFAAACATLAAAPLPHVWRNWHYSRTIEVPSTDTARLVGVSVPADVFRQSRWLHDLRVIDDLGGETPYVVQTREGSTSSVSLPTKIRENSFAPGQYTQVVVDLGEKAQFHNALQIQTPETDYIEWVSVEASDDAHVWRIVQARAPFFRFLKEGFPGTNTISYSENNARYLRIHILDQGKQFYVTGANVLRQTVTAPESVPLSEKFAPSASSTPGNSAWLVDFGAAGMPVSSVQFEVAAPAEFIRRVEISASDDNNEWQVFAGGEIYRYRRGEAAQEQLSVPIPSTGIEGRYRKVEIANRNDAPLSGVAVHLNTTPRHVYFEQEPGRSYRLIYGQSRANAPQYDLARRVDTKQEIAAIEGQVGNEEENSDYSDPRPWTEKNAYFLWIVMGIAVLVLGYSAVQSLKKSSSESASRA